MSLITIDTKWENISEFVLVGTDGTKDANNNYIFSYYSLPTDLVSNIKQEITKYNNFNFNKWKIGLTSIGLTYDVSDILPIDNSTNDQTSLFDTTNNFNVTNYFKEVKWGKSNSFLNRWPEYDDDIVSINITSLSFQNLIFGSILNTLEKFFFNAEYINSVIPNKNDVNVNDLSKLAIKIKNDDQTSSEIKVPILKELNDIITNFTSFVTPIINTNITISVNKQLDDGFDKVLNYYKLLKKKSKKAFMHDYIARIKNDPNFITYFINNQINIDTLNEYCCDNPYNTDCSTIYFKNSQIKGKLFYTTYNYTTIDNNVEDVSKILNFGYLQNPINNITNLYPDVQTPPEIANNGVTVIVGKLTIPISQTIFFKYDTNATKIIFSLDNVVYEFANNISSAKTIQTASYDLKIKIINNKNTSPYLSLYYSNDKVNWSLIPNEWYSTQYYFDIMKSYNDYLATECDSNWKNSNCYNIIRYNNNYISKIKQSIIDYCKLNPTTDVCKVLYNEDSVNYQIKKKYCIDNNNFVNNDKCDTFFKSNTDDDEIKLSQIRYCTNDKKVWNSAKCQEYILDGSTWYPKDQSFYDSYCLDNKNFKTDYNTCANNYTESNKRFTNTVIDYCGKGDQLFKTCIENVQTPEYITQAVNTNRLSYCNQLDKITGNTNCVDFVKSNLTNQQIQLDQLLIKNCINVSYPNTDPICGVVMDPFYPNLSNIPDFNKELIKSRCVDGDGVFKATDECKNRNIISNPNYFDLVQPTTKYCLKPENLDNAYCKQYNALNIDYMLSQNQSGFQDKNDDDNFNYLWVLLFIIFIIFIVLCIKNKDICLIWLLFNNTN